VGLRIVHESPSEFVVVKPAGLPSEVPRDPSADSVVRRLDAQGIGGLRLVHRLDAPACGLLLVARTRDAAAHYAQEVAARHWRKFYVARIAAPSRRARELVGPHTVHLRTVGRTARVVRSGGKTSRLTVLDAQAVPGAPGESHLLVELHTGRFHQIRAMLAHLGAPLTGDAAYGGPGDRVFYLEHVRLRVRLYGGADRWQTWQAPSHADRDPWAPQLKAAVADLALADREPHGGDAAGIGDVQGPGRQGQPVR
jgi:23S rRNA-/tRNA-specific pseudouridylate synthase